MPHRSDPAFAARIRSVFALDELDRHPGTVFGLHPDFRIAYVNSAWDAFAEANDGQPAIREAWDLGAAYLDAVPETLRPFYRDLLVRAPGPGEALHPPTHEYECSSAGVFRRMQMHVYTLPERSGYVVVNSTSVERPHDVHERPPHPARLEPYSDAEGIVRQCAHCRRIRRASDPSRWDWVPDWVTKIPAGTSHTICPICYRYYYPSRTGDGS